MYQRFVYITFILLGFFMIYRGTLEQNDFHTFEGRIAQKNIIQIGQYRSGTKKFALVIQLQNSNEKLGIRLGTKEQMLNDSLPNEIKPNMMYKFFVDPTVMKKDGINLGVRKVTNGSAVIYEEGQLGSLFVGIFLILVSCFFWLVFIRSEQK